MKKYTLEEYDYLFWFRQEADFGPATGDVIAIMNDKYKRKTGQNVPKGWKDEDYEG